MIEDRGELYNLRLYAKKNNWMRTTSTIKTNTSFKNILNDIRYSLYNTRKNMNYSGFVEPFLYKWKISFNDDYKLTDNSDVGGYSKLFYEYILSNHITFNSDIVIKLKKNTTSKQEDIEKHLNQWNNIAKPTVDTSKPKPISERRKLVAGKEKKKYKFISELGVKINSLKYAEEHIDKVVGMKNIVPFIISDNIIEFQNKLDIDEIRKQTGFSSCKNYCYFIGLILGKFLITEINGKEFIWKAIPWGYFFSYCLTNQRLPEFSVPLEESKKEEENVMIECLRLDKGIDYNLINEVAESDEYNEYDILRMYGIVDEEAKTNFKYLLKGFAKMVDTSKLNNLQLMSMFQCNQKYSSKLFVDQLNKILEYRVLDVQKKEQLTKFIKIVESLDDKTLAKIIKFFTGTSCCPTNINVGFNPYTSMFTAHLCFNTIDIPLNTLDKSKNDIMKKMLELSITLSS